MGQVYLADYDGPLYAYVEFEVNGWTISSTQDGNVMAGGAVAGIADPNTFTDNHISNVVMSFSIMKMSSENRAGASWNVGNEFSINVFDESAIYVEDIIANAMMDTSHGANCYVEYGWSAAGKRIDGRWASFAGYILGYTLSFEGSSTVLSIEGMSTEVTAIGCDYKSNEIPNDITASGNPGEIVRWIGENILSKETGVSYKYDIEATAVCYDDEEKTVIKNLVGNNASVYSYIDNLCLLSESEETGASDYCYWTTPEADGTITIHFRPKASNANYTTFRDDGSVQSNVNYSYEDNIVRTYDYYGNAQNNEVLSFSSEFRGYVAAAGVSNVSATDTYTNEMISVEVGDMQYGVLQTRSDSSRLLGLSASSYANLDHAMQDLWAKFASQPYGASLEIMGDPMINPQEEIWLNVHTKFHQLHHTSGIYIVKSVDDNVDSSGFTTTLALDKKAQLLSLNIGTVTETEGYNNPGTADGVDAGTANANAGDNNANTKAVVLTPGAQGFPSTTTYNNGNRNNVAIVNPQGTNGNTPTKNLTANDNLNTLKNKVSAANGVNIAKNAGGVNIKGISSVTYDGKAVIGNSDIANPVIYKG